MADTVLLDVDGTLIDSTYWQVVAWQQAFARSGARPPGWRLHRCIGMGGDKLVPAVAGEAFDEERGDAVRAAWKELYDRVLGDVQVLPGAADLVRELKHRGFTVVLASSGKPDHLEHARALLGADDAIDAVTSGDDAEASKPAGDVFAVAMQRVGAASAVVVGDSPWDVEAGRRVGAPTVALATGGFPVEWLHDAGAVSVHDDPADLLEHLDATVLAKPD